MKFMQAANLDYSESVFIGCTPPHSLKHKSCSDTLLTYMQKYYP